LPKNFLSIEEVFRIPPQKKSGEFFYRKFFPKNFQKIWLLKPGLEIEFVLKRAGLAHETSVFEINYFAELGS